MKRKIKPLLQLTRTECGLCCIAMVCQYFGFNKPMYHFRKYLHVGRDGSTIKSIAEVLEELGVKATIKRYENTDSIKITTPVVAILDNNHFVILEKNKGKDKLIINDPAVGKIVITNEEFESRVGKIIISTEKKSEFIEDNDSIAEWKPFLNILFSEKKKLFITVVLSLFIYIGVMFLPIIVQKLIDSLILYEELILTNRMVEVGITVFVLYVVTTSLKNFVVVRFETKIDKQLLFNVINKLVNLPYSFFELRTTGDLLFRLNLLNHVRNLIAEIIGSILDLAGMIFTVIYACTISYKLCFLTMIFLFVILLVTEKMNNKIVTLNYNELTELTNITMLESELINSIYDIKTLNIEGIFSNNIKNCYKKFSMQFQKRNWWTKAYGSVLQFFQLFCPICILIFNLINMKVLSLTLGEIIAFYSISSMMVSNEISFVQKLTNMKLMKNSLSRINEILLEDEQIKGTQEVAEFKELNIDNVSFSYSNSKDMELNNICIKIESGKKIAVVGESGAGKSTIVKLLTGLYDTSCGNISYNSINLKEIKRDSMMHFIGVVTQDAALFNKSIKENIILDKKDISKEELYEVLQQVGMLDEILAMPMREETLISEFGKNISGGQKQRLAMARTLINKPDFLIMDEATSSLDGINEKEITDFLQKIKCSQLIISHRLSTIENADYIYVMKKGEIIESGTIDELVSEKSYFYKMFASQLDKRRNEQ